jgi:protein involved in temperature-dependent protein secretion
MIALARLIMGTPWMLTAAAILLAATLGFAKGWSMEHDAKVAAVASRDLEWQLKITQANRLAEEDANARVQAALNAALAIAPTPAGDADLARLCDADDACRDGAKH